jgi:hypothetical protein
MFVLGILGEYIGRLYEESKGRPLFLIDQIIRAGSAINGDQIDWSQPEKKAGSLSRGAWDSSHSLKCCRIFLITSTWSMKVMMRISPRHWGQVSGSVIVGLYLIGTLSAFSYAVKYWPPERIQSAARIRAASHAIVADLNGVLMPGDQFLSAPLFGIPATFPV